MLEPAQHCSHSFQEQWVIVDDQDSKGHVSIIALVVSQYSDCVSIPLFAKPNGVATRAGRAKYFGFVLVSCAGNDAHATKTLVALFMMVNAAYYPASTKTDIAAGLKYFARR
jgi:hypothetical protein